MKLSDYIRGFRKGKEAHRLEKEAMRDPFLADALEGYSRVESGADEQIELLRRRVNMRVTQKTQAYHCLECGCQPSDRSLYRFLFPASGEYFTG